MRRSVSVLVLVLAMTLSLAGCGDGDTSDVDPSGVATSDADVVAYDPDGATSCEEIAAMYVGTNARLLDALGTRTDDEMAALEDDLPADIVAANEEFMAWLSGPARERVDELCTDLDEFEEYVCAEVPSLEAQGEAGERHLRNNLPSCDQS